MTPIFSLSSVLDSITPESLVWWLSRMTLVSVLACAYLALARRARPATRHLVAVGSLISIALLPVASALLPSWSLPVLPSVQATGTFDAPREVSSAIDASPTEIAPARTAPAEPAPAEPLVLTAGRVSSWPGRAAAVGSALDWQRVGLLAWVAVAIGLLLRIGMATLVARRFTRRTPATNDEILVRECQRACRALGIDRTIDVHVSTEVAIPMVVGVRHPRVILPPAAMVWSRDRLSVVLLHELAHVRRRDALWLRVARVVSALFWFHPLVWVLSRHVRRESERACDDVVLACGVRGSDYAEHLVAIARTVMTRDPLAGSALALATRSSLERRVVSILRARSPRAAISARMLAGATAGALVFLVVIAAARPTSVVSAQIALTDATMRVDECPSDDVVEKVEKAHPRSKALEPGFTFAIATAGAEDEGGASQKYYLADDRDERSGGDWYDRASDYYNRERYVQAGEAYEQAAHRGYRVETALYNAGCSYALAGKTDRAIDALRESFDEGFDRPELFAGDDDLNSLRADPRFRKLLDEVMNSTSAQSSRRAATREFERLAKRKNIDEGEWNSVGMDLLRSGDYERAAQAFDNEFKVSKDEDALYNKACARALDGKTADALTLLEQAIKTGSVDADHMEEDPDLITLHKEKRFDELLTLAEDLTLNQGGYFGNDGWWGKGSDEKRWRRAIPRLESVTREHPEIGRAWFNLGFAQLAAEEGDKGTAAFQKALDLGYRPPTTMYNLACSTAQAGDVDAAFAWLEKAEGAGMHMWSQARWDDDLDPLRSDPRYKKLAKQWRAEERARHEEKNSHKHDYDYNYDEDDDDEKDDTTN